jgi:hypothetical protein
MYCKLLVGVMVILALVLPSARSPNHDHNIFA